MSYISPASYLSKKSYRIVGPNEGWKYYNLLKSNPSLINAFDIETAESGGVSEETYDDLQSTTITQIQFATDKWNAIIFPRCDGEYKEITKQILGLSNITLGFNCWSFDNPILRVHDIDVIENRCHDLMWMFHHYQPKLPRGLQAVAGLAGFPFPWKHLFGADMELYGGADVCSLHFILDWLPGIMKARGVWEGYKRYVFGFRGKLLYPAQKLGLPVNEEKREKLKVKLIAKRGELDKELQEAVPFELRNFTPKKKLKLLDDETGKEVEVTQYGYERPPKKELIECSERYESGSKILKEQGKRVIPYESFLINKYSLLERQFNRFNRETGKIELQKVWCKVQPFKASFDQLTRYIKWKQIDLAKQAEAIVINGPEDKKEKKRLQALSKLYEVPKDAKGKETTAKGELESLSEKIGADPVFDNVIDIRSLDTNIKNYIPNWKPNPNDGCVHTTFGFSASSGQIDSRAPNVLNVSKHTETGQEFRDIIEAPKGYIFLEADKKSFHVATMGYVANDPSYIRFSQIDPHSIFTSYIMPSTWGKPIDLSLPDNEIRDICKWIKKKCKKEHEEGRIDIRQKQAKPVVLGNQLGLGYKKLYWQNRKFIKDPETALGYQEELDNLFPKVKEAKKEIIKRAANQTYLMNEFGYIQWFFDVINWTWNKRLNGGKGGWEERQGEEARDAMAFAVQSPAFGMIKDECMRIEPRIEKEVDIPFAFRLSIHDSLIFMFLESKLDSVREIVLEEMRKPCKKLVNEATGPEGLYVGVDYSIGRNWKNYDEKSNPEGMREVG
jgi:hypothetical protein